MPVLAAWDKNVRPINCRGHYGSSGTNWHYRNGTPTCDLCKASTAHQKWVKRSEEREKPLSRKEKLLQQMEAAVRAARRAGEKIVLGCNGKFGGSGYDRHRRAGEKACFACCASRNQWNRYRKPLRVKQGCGTIQAVWRHRKAKETLDFKCRVAETAHAAERYKRKKGITA